MSRPPSPGVNGTALTADLAVERRDFTVTLDLSLEEGERLALYGTSGAGKTTILEALAGGVRLDRGGVIVGGRLVNAAAGDRRTWRGRIHPRPRHLVPVAPRDRLISVVRQPVTLFPHLSVAGNVAYGLGGRRPSVAVLEEVGLPGFGAVPASKLSGGQRQRVALARAIGRGFRALLLDEPLSAVDVAARPALIELAAERVAGARAVGVLVTHELGEAQSFGDRLAVIDRGRVLQIGDPHSVVANPAERRVAELCGYGAFLPASTPGQSWAIHPERCKPGEHPELGPVITGRVTAVHGYGPRWACTLEVSQGVAPPVMVQVRVEMPPQLGREYTVTAIHPPLVASVALGGSEEKPARA